MPATTPPNCAVGKCDTNAGVCSFVAKDADNDGHATKACASSDPGVTISLGDDCDDGNPDVHPGAWDGPEDPADPTNKPDHCNDGIDQNCSGADGEMAASNGASCACDVGDTSACSEDSGGIPITWPTGSPVGECKYGTKLCEVDAQTNQTKWGQCNGAIAPTTEVCDGNKDEDCKGDGDALAIDKPSICPDGDGDTYCLAQGCKTSDSCDIPTAWSATSSCSGKTEPDTCDGSAAQNRDAVEACDHVDNDCDGQVDEGVLAVYCKNGDGDGYCDLVNCTQPVCPTDVDENLWWKRDGVCPTVTDCDDGINAVNPGATEVCNHIDDNCAGGIDEGLTAVYCKNGDGDGYCDLGNCTQQPVCAIDVDQNVWWKRNGVCPATTDCNDSTGAVNPGASESCNGVDDNCGGGVDEGVAASSDTCTVGVGECAVTQAKVCVGGSYQCTAQQNPAGTETCDSKDNDCDGRTDNILNTASPITEGCWNGPCNSARTCSAGQWGYCPAPNACPASWGWNGALDCTYDVSSYGTRQWDQYSGGDYIVKDSWDLPPGTSSFSNSVHFSLAFSQSGVGCWTSDTNATNRLWCHDGGGNVLAEFDVHSEVFASPGHTVFFTCPSGTSFLSIYKAWGGSGYLGCQRFADFVGNVFAMYECKY